MESVKKYYNEYYANRDGAIDICRGICILLVIIGHQLQNQGLVSTMQIIYSFHMPLMFIISGFFIKKENNCKFIQKKMKRLLVPYFLGTIVMCIVEMLQQLMQRQSVLNILLHDMFIIIYGSGNGHGSFLYIKNLQIGTRDEIGMLWFLLALFWGSIIVQLVLESKKTEIYLLIISLAGYFSSRIVWLPFSIQNGCACSIWIYFGYIIRNRKYIGKITYLYKKIEVLIIGGGCWGISILWGKTYLFENYLKLGIIEVIGAIFASGIVYICAKWLENNTKHINKFLQWVGMNTIVFYILHFWENRIFPISIWLNEMGFARENYVTVSMASIIIILICIAGTKLFANCKYMTNIIKTKYV